MANGGFRQRLAQASWLKYVVIVLLVVAAVVAGAPYVVPKKVEVTKITQISECEFETKDGERFSFGNSYWKQTPCDVMQSQIAKFEGKNTKFAVGGIVPASTPLLGGLLGKRVVWVAKPTKDEIRKAREEAEQEEGSGQQPDEREAGNTKPKDQGKQS